MISRHNPVRPWPKPIDPPPARLLLDSQNERPALSEPPVVGGLRWWAAGVSGALVALAIFWIILIVALSL